MRGGRFPAEKEGRELVEQLRPVDKGKFEMTTYNTNPFVAIAVGIAFEHDPIRGAIPLDELSRQLRQRAPALSRYNCECVAAEMRRQWERQRVAAKVLRQWEELKAEAERRRDETFGFAEAAE